MANKNTEIIKVETPSDLQPFGIVNYDLTNVDIESLIRTLRGQKVMIDFDLAMLYGVKTKVLNQSVKRNLKRFPACFYCRSQNHGKQCCLIPESLSFGTTSVGNG